MNLQKLFELQRQLDEHIEQQHPRQPGEDRLAKKILALQVEIGELANEWRGFKFWSNDQKPRREKIHYSVTWIPLRKTDPLLEEYVDALHFILSIGMEYSYRYGEWLPINLGLSSELIPIEYEHITKQFNYMFQQIGYFYDCVADCEIACNSETEEQYEQLFRMFIGLGNMLGFTWEEIEEAYMQKNEVNHQRQANEY
ncbi:dUTP diphosphatase [Anoxybacteroides rupiense]|uniref:dUTP diphosphatase n=1 Tax=Anoxybacteroides rupiense TaxID=311460 RepID=UPI001F09062D|nr:dUTP diphosphatase [Anoxybacillus rupiensis]